MAQCFVSTYRNHYRGHDPVNTPSAKIHYDEFTTAIPTEPIWIETTRDADDLNLGELEKRMHKFCLKRYITTYQRSYCQNQIAKLVGEPQETSSAGFENQLLENCKNLYEPESRPKIAPPLGGTRRIFGYVRPSRNYTPLTNYQHFYGKTGFKILKGEYRHSLMVPQDVPENKKVQQNERSGEEEKEEKEAIETTCCCDCCLKRSKK